MVEKRKICMVGAAGVGKSSLVARFVRSIFSDAYRTTVGVVIETCRVTTAVRPVDLIIWDLNGEDEFQRLQLAYLRGAAGYLLVIDGTRRETLHTAVTLRSRAAAVLGSVPLVVAVNKIDLITSWEISARDLEPLVRAGLPVVQTSARTGVGVETAFRALADATMAVRQHA